MTQNVVHLKAHQFKKGFDPKRNTTGAPKGKNFRYAFGQQMFEKHKDNLEQIVDKVVERAIWGHEPSQKLCFDYFITKPVTDITVENCDYNMILEDMVNIPKDVLETMRSNFVDQLSKYSDNDNKEIEGD
jgi:DNA-binding ferritin-like protein